MLIKLQLSSVLFAALCCACLIAESRAYCSLEKMKTFAMEACEHLFLQDEPREKRSVHYDSELYNEIGHYKSKAKKHFNYNVRRSIYPQGGYLKVGHSHYMKLSQVDVSPKYKAKHMKAKKLHEKERYKRDHSGYNNLPYCCFNNCDEDFFC